MTTHHCAALADLAHLRPTRHCGDCALAATILAHAAIPPYIEYRTAYCDSEYELLRRNLAVTVHRAIG